MARNAAEILQDIYDSEINLTISWFWDGGINLVIGDKHNGIRHADHFDNMRGVITWLIREIPRMYPDSDFARKWGNG